MFSLFSEKALTENLALRVAKLYKDGSSFGKISDEMEISRSRVGNLIREGMKAMENPDRDSDEAPIVQSGGELENTLENKDEFSFAQYGGDRYLDGVLNRSFLIQATPLLRKVALNSKVFMQHEYFQKFLGYEGDVGDLLVEALDFYWKAMGFTIKVTHDSVI